MMIIAKKVFNPKCLDNIVKSFGSVFGTGLSGRQGIVQDLNRNAMLGHLSHKENIKSVTTRIKVIGTKKIT